MAFAQVFYRFCHSYYLVICIGLFCFNSNESGFLVSEVIVSSDKQAFEGETCYLCIYTSRHFVLFFPAIFACALVQTISSKALCKDYALIKITLFSLFSGIYFFYISTVCMHIIKVDAFNFYIVTSQVLLF